MLGLSPDADNGEAVAADFVRSIDVAEIDE
jgi:hypothetical protein